MRAVLGMGVPRGGGELGAVPGPLCPRQLVPRPLLQGTICKVQGSERPYDRTDGERV